MEKTSSNPYETTKILSEYLSTFYFTPENPLISPSFSLSLPYLTDYHTSLSDFLITIAKKHLSNTLDLSALDIGCGVGRLSFELSIFFSKILAIDYSRLFVETCKTLQRTGFYDYSRHLNGDIYEDKTALLPKGLKPERIEFLEGNAEELGNIGPFDLIVASNLIDRLKNPKVFLKNTPKLLNKQGVLVITSPYTWSEDYSSKSEWIGGKDGIKPFDALKDIMSGIGLELIEEKTFMLFIPEHERKFQMCLPHVTVWKMNT